LFNVIAWCQFVVSPKIQHFIRTAAHEHCPVRIKSEREDMASVRFEFADLFLRGQVPTA
jgi:hypothetical protein